MLGRLVTLCLALLPFAQCIQIHKHMTPEEVRKTFQTGHDNLPDYEVVRIYHTLHKRDANDNSPQTVKVNAFNRRLSLYLEPSEGLLAGVMTRVYTVEKDSDQNSDGIRYAFQQHALDGIEQVYRDIWKRSAIVAYAGEDGETLLQGNLMEDLNIAPLPHRLHDIVLRETREVEDSFPDGIDGEADFRRSHHHVVFKRREPETDAFNDCIKVVKPDGISSGATANNRSKRSIPSIVYPEILVIVDNNIFEAVGKDVDAVARYVLAFWNAVDLRFRLLEEPKIRLNIAGIIISTFPGGTPYLENHRRDSNKVDASLALPAISQYFYKIDKLRFVTYDLTIVMTHLDMCLMTNGVCDGSTCGYAFVKGACNVINSAKKTQSVGLIEDNGGYSGINTAAHELGHLLGIPHDGRADTVQCPDTDGYIMSHMPIHRENNFQWSKCSLAHLYDFLSAPTSSCLRDMPYPDTPLRRLLPGQLMTPDEQCGKFILGSKSCNNGPEICTALGCTIPGKNSCRTQSAAAEGTSCGDEMFCINGYCVSKKATYVPYSEDHAGQTNSTPLATLT